MSTREWCVNHKQNCGGAWNAARDMMGESTCVDCGCGISSHSRKPVAEPGTQTPAEIIAETDQTLRMTLAEFHSAIRGSGLEHPVRIAIRDYAVIMLATELESLLAGIEARCGNADPWSMTAGDVLGTIQETIDGIRKGLE